MLKRRVWWCVSIVFGQDGLRELLATREVQVGGRSGGDRVAPACHMDWDTKMDNVLHVGGQRKS